LSNGGTSSSDASQKSRLGPAIRNATVGAIQMKVERKVSRTVLSASSEILHHPHVSVTRVHHDCDVRTSGDDAAKLMSDPCSNKVCTSPSRATRRIRSLPTQLEGLAHKFSVTRSRFCGLAGALGVVPDLDIRIGNDRAALISDHLWGGSMGRWQTRTLLAPVLVMLYLFVPLAS
jgi:hypothetical protein